MKYTTLPNTETKVSKICLGTMTFGEQNTEEEGHAQMDYALENGVNFFDAAEMYSVPARQETYGSTEKIIGTWFKKTGNRENIVWQQKSQVQIQTSRTCVKRTTFLLKASPLH